MDGEIKWLKMAMVWYSYLQRNDPLPSISLYDVTTNKVLVLMSKINPVCRDCGVELNDENWYISQQKANRRICKSCELKKNKQWRMANPEKARAQKMRYNRKQGQLPFSKNKKCPQYLGVHIAERVLSYAFKNVQRMPLHNSGFDFICGQGYMIDVKSSCKQKNRNGWGFRIGHNTIADYFLCLAFDNREDLNPLHAWLIPGEKINHLTGTSICPSTIHKWDEYKLDISKVVKCCDVLR